MARIKDYAPVDARSRRRRTWSPSSGAHAAAAPGRPLDRPLPVPRGAHAELLGERPSKASTTASAAARAATRSRSSRRPRTSTSPGRSSGSPTGSTSRSSTRSPRRGLEEERGRRERLLDLLDAGGGFYERYLWDSQAGGPRARLPRRPRAWRGGLPRVPARARARRERPWRGRRVERGFTVDELAAAGLVNRPADDYFARRLLFPLADARGRVLGFQARKLREDDPLRAKYVNSPEGELFRKGDLLYGPSPRGPRSRRAGRAVVVEGNTDVIALRPDRASSRSSRRWGQR